jgi:subtilisin-like proprotein convertase family protein/V8-like Glu-specific endopeptidase
MRLKTVALVAMTAIMIPWVSTAANERVKIIGEHLYGNVLETPHPYPGSPTGQPVVVWSDSFAYPGAEYLVFQFDQFDLADGDWVEVRDPSAKQVHRYEGKGFKGKGGQFISKMILSSEAEILLWSTNPESQHYGYRIDRITRGFSQLELAMRDGTPEAICGADDKKDAICYETSYPQVYDEARSVARIVMDGSALCTAWLVSCENHVITNNHCTWDDSDFDTQGELDRMEFQFMYQDATCGGGSPTYEYSFMGGTWLEHDHDLDYTLIQAPNGESPAATYGWLTIDYRLADIDEQIYIVGHPSGRPKEIGLESTDAADGSGLCEVYSQTEPVCVGGTVPEIGYMCDTEGGNSGSPVLSLATNKVVALHHCADCPNRGVRIQNVWDMNQAGLNPLPACSLNDEVGSVALDRGHYGCADTITIEVNDGSLIGTVTPPSVTIWSTTEATPETVILTETPPNSGSFFGTIPTSTSTATNGDGNLSVTSGDTITVQYIDASDGQGGTNIPKQDAAVADCASPTIDSVTVSGVGGSSALITWNTNEDATSAVTYDVTAPPSANTELDASLVTSHSVQLDGLSACTTYVFQVSSTDEAGNPVTDDNSSSYYGFTTGGGAFYALDATDTPVAIPDNTPAGASSVVSVVSSYLVDDVNVLLNITHTWDADLDITLEGPDGTMVDLSSGNGSLGDNYVNTLFDDDAATPVTAGSAPFTGSYSPEQALATFIGHAAQGDWTLHIVDDANNDTGTLNSWQLQLTIGEPCGDPTEIFLDGFETGTPAAWSYVSP